MLLLLLVMVSVVMRVVAVVVTAGPEAVKFPAGEGGGEVEVCEQGEEGVVLGEKED